MIEAPKTLFISELVPEALAKVERRMRAGTNRRAKGYDPSEEGFLGDDERLADVIERDEATLASLGVTPEAIADWLDALIGLAAQRERLLGDEVDGATGLVLGRFRVETDVYMGSQDCPFFYVETPRTGGGRYISSCGSGSTEHRIRDETTGASLFLTGLHPHLIRAHHFFEGATSYRLEPARAVEVLGLGEAAGEAPPLVSETVWELGSSSSEWTGALATHERNQRLRSEGIPREPLPGLIVWTSDDEGWMAAPIPVAIEEPLEVDGARLDPGVVFSGGAQLRRRTIERYADPMPPSVEQVREARRRAAASRAERGTP